MHLFDEDVVLYRTADGTAQVVEAYCPHLGAHIGEGGCVKGETLQCPFHGWRFDLEGRNVEIPFSDTVNKSVRLKQWHTREFDHLIIVWYDALGRDPWWEWPGIPEFRDPDYHQPHEYEGAAVCYGALTVVPQLPMENNADPLHFPFVHGTTEPVVMERFELKEHESAIRVKILFGGGKGATWATPDGPTYGIIEGSSWGLGMGVARFEIAGMRAAQVVCTTPIDRDHSYAFGTIAALREPGATELSGRSKKIIDEQLKQVRSDFRIWEHQRYVLKPSFVMPQERNFAAFRRWARQFYPDADQSNVPLEWSSSDLEL
jgi:nitrite reductase/ring-hydroxylating ferredoxin subunit